MAIPVKACVIGGLGCVASIAYGLSQAESSLSVREKLAFEGYVLISEKEKIETEVWKNRTELYEKEYSTLSLEGLSKEEVKASPTKLKDACSKYTEKNVATNKLAEGVYEKLTKLCTLTIKEYIKSHLNKEEEKLIDQSDANDWKKIYEVNKEGINKVKKITNTDSPKEEIKKICEEFFVLQKSNKEKDKEYQASQWCVERKEKPADKAEEEDSDSDSD